MNVSDRPAEIKPDFETPLQTIFVRITCSIDRSANAGEPLRHELLLTIARLVPLGVAVDFVDEPGSKFIPQ